VQPTVQPTPTHVSEVSDLPQTGDGTPTSGGSLYVLAGMAGGGAALVALAYWRRRRAG
jgi:hypothetical protein